MANGVLTLARIFLRAYLVDGVPGSGVNSPLKSDGLNAFAQIDAALTDLTLFSAIGVAYATLATLETDTGAAARTLGLVYNDPTPANDGIYVASGTGTWANTNIALPSAIAAAVTQLQASVPWYATTWAQVAQVKIALQNAGVFNQVDNAVTGDPTQPVNAWWTTGALVTVGGTLGAFIQATLGYSSGQMTALWEAAAAVPF